MSHSLSARPHLRTALMAGSLALAMAGLAYASVPLYRIFCQVTGFGGTTQVADSAAAPVAPVAATIRVRFDSNVRGVPWEFRPTENRAELAIGERRMAFYRAANMSDRPVTGMATYNVSPAAAGRYFVKIQCFCFNEQTLAPGEAVDMPVIYYVDPAILDDPDAAKIDEITLSYTFFPVEQPRQAPGVRATTGRELAGRR
jgi:cytochrome c oxidase assembly protein subunit 11